MANGREDVVEVAECLTKSWALKLRTSLRIVVATLCLCVSVRHGITTIESKVLNVCIT